MKILPIFFLLFLVACASSENKIHLIAQGPCKEAYEYHFLNRAASADDIVGLELLLQGGADPNGKGYKNYPDCVAGIEFSSPLMVATWSNNLEIVKILLAAGADPNLLEGEGVSPTGTAQKLERTEILALLKKYGGQ